MKLLLLPLLAAALSASPIQPDLNIQLPGPITMNGVVITDRAGIYNQFPQSTIVLNDQGTLEGLSDPYAPAKLFVWAPGPQPWDNSGYAAGAQAYEPPAKSTPVPAVPEPGTLAMIVIAVWLLCVRFLLGAGLVGIARRRRG